MKLSTEISTQAFDIRTEEELRAWLVEVDRSVGGLAWTPVGGIENNVHAVEVASDPAAALVENVTNAIDAILDLEAQRAESTAASPHEAARAWLKVPAGGVSGMKVDERQRLADSILISNHESGKADRPTVTVQDRGCGQHPDDFSSTLMSLMASNKKSKNHQMGVYNAGAAATYVFCPYTIVVSRCAPSLLGGRSDEIGFTVVRYDPLDPDRYKSGTYLYCTDAKGGILRLALKGGTLPRLEWGTYVKHVAYDLPDNGRAAHEPKASLHHLLNSALPDPALPFWVEEKREDRFSGVRAGGERRVITGLVARLGRKGTCEYHDERFVSLGLENGSVLLRYFVLDADQDPDAFTSKHQGLSFLLNGQRHGMKDRYWVKRNTGLNYLWRRLVILVDCNGLSSSAKRQVFASTRESSKESEFARSIVARVKDELSSDDELTALDEEARQRTLSAATSAVSKKVKKQLAGQISAFLSGTGPGNKGGAEAPAGRLRKPPVRRDTDDTDMLSVPDTIKLLSDPIRIRAGTTAPVYLEINGKNGFLPKHDEALTVVVGPELKDTVRLRSKGRLMGGRVRLMMESDKEAPLKLSSFQVALVAPELSLALIASGSIEVRAPKRTKKEESKKRGGEADIEVNWIQRAGWEKQVPPWTENVAGECVLERKDPSNPRAITRAEFQLNEAFKPLEDVLQAKKVGEDARQRFYDAYIMPVCWGFFMQATAELQREQQADAEGTELAISDEYLQGERERLARTILLAMEPGLAAAVRGEE